MANKTINTRQKQKYDTSTNWTTNNPVLLAGELGIESDTNKFKIGNGTSAWNELDYAGGGDLVLYSTTGQNTDGAMTQKAVTDALSETVDFITTSLNGDLVITNEQFEKLFNNPNLILRIIYDFSEQLGQSITLDFSCIVSSSQQTTDILVYSQINPSDMQIFGDSESKQSMSITLIRNNTTQEVQSIIDTIDIVSDTNYVHTDNNYTTEEKNKLAGIEAGAEVNTVTSVNGKTGAITLSADDVNALPDTTEIPSTLADLTDDSTHRTVTDTEKSTWNAKSDFSGSYNDLTDKPTIPTININGVAQSTINFDSDPQTQIDNIINNTTKIANGIQFNGIDGGFSAGTDSSATWGGAVGYSAVSEDGGSIGQHSQTTSGGAVGALTDSDTGFAGGHSSKSLDSGVAIGDTALAGYSSINQQYTGNKPITGVAIGSGAKTFIGVAIGYNAIAHAPEMNTGAGTPSVYDCIQLGTGTNNNSKTLQVYDDNIYDANTHNLSLLGSFSALNNIGGGFSISDPVNVGIELGRKDGTPGTPYIDFHTDGQASTDFNSRILASGSELQITASGGVSINGYNIASVIQEYMSGTTGYLRLNTGDREYLICWGVISQSFRDGDRYNFTLPNSLTYNNQSWHLSVTADGYTDAAQLNGRVSANNGFYLQSQRYSNRTQDLIVSWQASGFVS